MVEMSPASAERLRQGFKKYLNPFMLAIWRLGMGKWFTVFPKVSGLVMVITHTGRKTGIKRYQPVNYAIVDGDIYCVAAFGRMSDWYRNIMAHPAVEVWLPDGWWAGTAEDASSSPERMRLIRQVLIGSGFAAYAAGIDPYKITEEELEAESRSYRLVRISRTEARTGPGGPGELEWIWQAATFALLGIVLFRRRRK